MNQADPSNITIQLNHAELLLPTRDNERPDLVLKGRIVSNLRIVTEGGDDDISRYTGEVSITRSDEERDHVGTAWVEHKNKIVGALIFAGAESFDRIVAQLSGAPTEQQMQLGLAGLSSTDDEGGTLNWHGKGATFTQSLLSAQLIARLF